MGANGRTTIDFGAFPGSSHASVDVSGQTGLVADSEVEAWLIPVATADHTADEHKVETIKAVASYKVDGTLTIDAFNTSELHEPLVPFKGVTGTIAGGLAAPQGLQQPTRGGLGTRIWGLWTAAWAWN
jgi:hypothetical protein